MALKLGPAILTIISFVAIMLGIIFNAISIDELQYRSPEAKTFDNKVVIDDKSTDLVWFLQVTDLHLSNRGHYERISDFRQFARDYVDIFKPDAILVTGDITDAIVPNTTLKSGPQIDEWLAYADAVESSKVLEKTQWLDVRGNHDNFNVYRPSDNKTMYRKYSVQGKKHARNYMQNIVKDGKTYTFIGVDEVQTPGLKIPFNFIGIVNSDDIASLDKFKKESDELKTQYRVWFAHYPTSSIASPNEGLRNTVDGPYLCGHYHTIGNLVPKMHSTQQPGFAEVELGDWKYSRKIRLAAVDHQLFSLVDFYYKQFPIALMTNPKNAEYVMPKYEPVDRLLTSTHLRVIAFSNVTVTKVEISIDDAPSIEMKLAKDPLYTHQWDPKKYSTGLHTAKIIVTDSEGKKQTFRQTFSMDNSKEEFSFGARVLIRVYFKSYSMAMFFFIVTMCTFPLVILRLIGYNYEDTTFKRHYRETFLHSLHLLSNVKRLFWPLIVIPFYVAIGPLFVGYLLDEAIGACFVWGVLIDGGYVHTGITFIVGSLFLLLIHIPITSLLAAQVAAGYKNLIASSECGTLSRTRIIFHMAVTCLQLWMGTILLSAYGAMSYFTSLPIFWTIFVYAYCWYQCSNLTRADFVKFDSMETQEEQQALRSSRSRDDKSSTSDQSTC